MICGRKKFSYWFFFCREPLPYKKISSARPLKISFFLQSAFQNLFFPGECLLKYIFSWRVPLKICFFLEKGLRIFFPPAPPLTVSQWRQGLSLIRVHYDICSNCLLIEQSTMREISFAHHGDKLFILILNKFHSVAYPNIVFFIVSNRRVPNLKYVLYQQWNRPGLVSVSQTYINIYEHL